MVEFSGELLVPGLIILSVIVVLGFFFVIFVRSQKRLDIEQGQEPLYTSTAGGQIGWVNYRGPFISLRIYEDFIVVGSVKIVVLSFEEIERVEIKKWMGTISDRIQIIHHQPGVPSRIIIGTGDPSRVKEIIDSKLQKSS